MNDKNSTKQQILIKYLTISHPAISPVKINAIKVIEIARYILLLFFELQC
jgi:hypothetical protein